ncbi:MAG: putative baseplate assembly protein [Cyanobacteria bacterium J06643_5]
MEFDFLAKLPNSNLDDRTFQDLVDECILRIPRYCPEWTNYNPGDPGITLVELFAWLTDQMLLRFNQVPRRNYVTFLEMLGIRLQPAAPARTEVTFYLSSSLPDAYEITAGAEVATIRTETESAIVFSTDQSLIIGQPQISHFLSAQEAETTPFLLRDRLTNIWTQQDVGGWFGRPQPIFTEQPQPGNCFYLVFNSEQPLDGNVIAIKLTGEAATSIGINPDYPPRSWEAWNGHSWQPILLQESDDDTRGFSFNEPGLGDVQSISEADVVLHLPDCWPVTYFSKYQGRWLRCIYTPPIGTQSGYLRSPRLLGVSARAIGGTVNASQCTLVRDEVLGVSDGTPGQKFQLQNTSIMPRKTGEHILVLPPSGLPEIWQEVSDFADSDGDSHHYILDSVTGQVQFGPLIREPAQMREQVKIRSRLQAGNASALEIQGESPARQMMERQYGAIPPRGSQIRMVAYRTGGGLKGNVQSGTLRILKTAIPYVERVINHNSARNGADAESLEDAIIRVPRILRTRDRAVTPEDFETLTLEAVSGAIARTYCPPNLNQKASRGLVNLLVVPQANIETIETAKGINPNQLMLSPALKTQILSYLDERRLLGVEVQLNEPEYVGVSVQAEVGLEPEYNNPQAQEKIVRNLQVALYRFLNPLTGGKDGKGWQFGANVYPSDIVSLFQNTIGVRYLGAILLFELRKQDDNWIRTLAPNGIINPGNFGLICSWADSQLRSSHAISII